jgi:hypothetical protein
MSRSLPEGSIFVRPVRRRKAKKMSDVDYHLGPAAPFGKDAPHVGIGSSRRAPRAPPETPGPGAYDPPAAPANTHLPLTLSPTERGTSLILPITTTIDSLDAPAFQHAALPSTSRTGDLHERGVFPINDAPGCHCPPISQLSNRSHAIQGKFRPERPDDTPGPNDTHRSRSSCGIPRAAFTGRSPGTSG